MKQLESLRHGDLVSIVSPAYWLGSQELDAARTFLETRGFRVRISRQCYSRNGQFAGTDGERADAINAAFADQECSAILCAKGGYGTSRILAHIDFDLVGRNPKIFVGYSDITCLLNVIAQRCGFPTFHGPMGLDFTARKEVSSVDDLFRFLAGDVVDVCDYSPPEGSVLRAGEACDSIWGGNLSLIEGMIGTAYSCEFDGKILFFEEVDEALYRIDRALNHLFLTGSLHDLKGVLIGKTVGLGEDSAKFGISEAEVYRSVFNRLPVDCPVVMNMPFGHGPEKLTLPIGWPLSINARTTHVNIRTVDSVFRQPRL